jgi:enoyl-CoA hydratase/carnithine racemase
MADDVLCSLDGSVATVTLNRPDKRNALNRGIVDGLRRIFARLESERDVRVVVLRGAGRAFCSGMDLEDLSGRQQADGDPERDVIDALRSVEQSRHPTIAMVHAAAYAGGCELALHCDLRVAADTARFAMPLARLGLVLPFPLARKLVEIVGPAYTREILLTGRPVDARRAYEMGLIHQLVPAPELETVTYALARSIAENAPLALAGLKATILRAAVDRERVDHADLDALVNRVRKSADAREGVRAMLEKRTPVFGGE